MIGAPQLDALDNCKAEPSFSCSEIVIPRGSYQIVYADPPWEYKDKANAGKRGACHKYNVLSTTEICALNVPSICAPNCLLALWWVAPMPADALRVVEAWGFTLKTMKGFTWRKLTTRGLEHFGMGHWTRANTEDCLFATRGKPTRKDCGVRQVINAIRREHSKKPDEARDRLVQMLGDVPRIELFARTKSPGWDAWGDEV